MKVKKIAKKKTSKKRKDLILGIRGWMRKNQRDIIIALLFATLFFIVLTSQERNTQRAYEDRKNIRELTRLVTIPSPQIQESQWMTVSDVQERLSTLNEQLKQCKANIQSVQRQSDQVKEQLDRIGVALNNFNRDMGNMKEPSK